MSWVLRNSPERLGNRLVLLVLADKADEDGTNAWPSVATIAREARMNERQVQRCLSELRASGAIVQKGRHRQGDQRHGTYVYDIVMKGDNMSPFDDQRVTDPVPKGDISDIQRVSDLPPEPSLEQPSLEPSLSATPQNGHSERPRNETWDALAAIFGEPTTRSAQKVRGKVCSSLQSARASPSEIETRARRWPLHFDKATLTDLALEKHWDTLGRKPLRRQ